MQSEEVSQRFKREKQAYWAMRAELLKQYPGKWVAVVNEQGVAIGDNRGKVMEEAFRQTKSKVMFVGEVGHEDRVLLIRQHSTGKFDHSYQPPVPMMTAPVSDNVNAVSLVVKSIRIILVVPANIGLVLMSMAWIWLVKAVAGIKKAASSWVRPLSSIACNHLSKLSTSC